MRILIIDDNEIDRYIMKEYLAMEKTSFDITEVQDGEEALNYLKTCTEPPDIILLDINMPRMSGFEFLENYTAIMDRHHTYVFMLSSSDLDYEQEKAFSFKCVKDFLVKPFNKEAINKLQSTINI